MADAHPGALEVDLSSAARDDRGLRCMWFWTLYPGEVQASLVDGIRTSRVILPAKLSSDLTLGDGQTAKVVAQTCALAARNHGHGLVFPRPDGLKAECEGPPACTRCADDLAHLLAGQGPA